jgi:hypothetical protein
MRGVIFRWKSTRDVSCLVLALAAVSSALANAQTIAAQVPQSALKKDVYLSEFKGVDATGATDSWAGIQAAIDSGAAKLNFPCGVYMISRTIELRSDVEIVGQGDCTIVRPFSSIDGNPSWKKLGVEQPKGHPASVFANADWSNGNNNIAVSNIVLDGSAGTGGGRRIYLGAFYKVSSARINRVRFIGGGNNDVQIGAAFINSRNFSISNCVSDNERSACYGVWDGSRNFRITNNVCNGGGIASGGIVINGLSTDSRPNTSQDGIIANNTISNTQDTGIFVGGLWNGITSNPVYGSVSNVTIENNTVDGVSHYHGILISDASNIRVVGNVVKSIARQGIRIGSQFLGMTSDVWVEKNVVENADQAPISDDAIKVTHGADNVTLKGNVVSHGRHRFAIRIDPDATNVTVLEGPMARGTSGTVSNAGARR